MAMTRWPTGERIQARASGSLRGSFYCAGHTVHATVRDPARNTEQLQALPGATERLKLFKADLTTPGR